MRAGNKGISKYMCFECSVTHSGSYIKATASMVSNLEVTGCWELFVVLQVSWAWLKHSSLEVAICSLWKFVGCFFRVTMNW